MPNVLKTAKSADSWRPSAERRKIQTLDQCFLKGFMRPCWHNVCLKGDA